MTRTFHSFGILLLCLTFLAGPSTAQTGGKDFTEEFFFDSMQTVVTSGGTGQGIDRSPAAVSIISAEEIRASGAMSIPEALRFVPGLDVMRISGSHREVGARGFNEAPGNKMLVMIDGRSVYFDYYGGVTWESLPVVMDQIERIEVMRSPGSAIHGANAFSGVINIITRTPAQSRGARLYIQGGENSRLESSFLAGGDHGRTSYCLALGGQMAGSLEDPDRNSGRMLLGNLALEHHYGMDTRLCLETGLSTGFIDKIFLIDMNRHRATNSFARLNLDHGDFSLQTFWNRSDHRDKTYTISDRNEEIFSNTFDVEARNSCNLNPENTFTLGASCRLNTIRSNILDSSHIQSLAAVYLQDEYRPVPELTLLAGARLDRHPLTGINFSPRASVIFSPRKSHTFRLTVNRAFRNPSHLNSYLYHKTAYGIRLVGNTELEPEKITSWEAGYIFSRGTSLKLKLDMFFLELHDYIALEESLTVAHDLTLENSFANIGRAEEFGGEATIDYVPVSEARLSLSYSYQEIRNAYTVMRKKRPPEHKAHLKAFLSLPKNFSLFLGLSHTGGSTWEIPTGLGLYQVRTCKAYNLVDCRLGWTFRGGESELFIRAANLLDSRARGFPLAEEDKRCITCGTRFSF